MKNIVLSFICGVAIAAVSSGPALAAPPNITGMWTVDQQGLNGGSSATITLKQSGMSVVGSNAKNGNGFTGTFVNDTQINGTWKGPGGAGWLTVYVSPNGHSFNGTWGYNGRKANGSFVGNKVLPPSPVTAAGTWNVAGAGGPTAFVGTMKCTQSGKAAVCKIGPAVINGAFKTADKIRAKWTGPGKTGWFSFWFNDDNNSFNGVWGYGPDTTPAVGRVVGQRAL
ncbi:MAG: hypothetical protein JOZ38_09355 [Candidatus Eremiobacteraeota bacterium]|nr:hypothetical protein [Candidatus Eremiobacteraeota bacterium]